MKFSFCLHKGFSIFFFLHLHISIVLVILGLQKLMP